MKRYKLKSGEIRFTLMGTGTSSGVPTIGCKCEVCLSSDPKDKRLRCSLLIETGTTTVVVDTSADFRQQMLLYGVDKIDAVVYTHQHFDHIGGFDDIRAFNFVQHKATPIYINQSTLSSLKQTFSYAFGKAVQVGGGLPTVELNMIDRNNFWIGDIEFEIIPMMHGKIEVLGFRIGDFAYCTDTNYIAQESLDKLKNLDILILDALRYHPHPTHYTVKEAIEIAQKLNAKETYFTHIAHQISHSKLSKELPEGIFVSYDGLEFIFDREIKSNKEKR
jgi:phosphoribosyl 1,2-cyclic phosphate phosphodiesterase